MEGLLEIAPAVVSVSSGSEEQQAGSKPGSDSASDSDSGSGGGDDVMLRLLEVSLDLLSQSQQASQPAAAAGDASGARASAGAAGAAVVYSSKGIREAVRRVWQALCSATDGRLPVEVIDGIVAATTGEDISDDAAAADADEEEGEDDADGDGEEDEAADDDDEDGDDGVNEKGGRKNHKGKIDKMTTAATVKASKKPVTAAAAGGNDDEEEEDIMLSEEDALQLLNESDDDEDGDDDGALQHDESMDAALVHMLNLKKQARKQGLLRAQKQELLVRLRAMDLLEIVVDRVSSGLLLFPTFLPLLNCVRKSYSSMALQSIAEGTSFTQRLHTLIEQKVCCNLITLLSHCNDYYVQMISLIA